MILNGRHVTLQELSESVARTKRAEFYQSHIKRPTSCLGECLRPEIRLRFMKSASTAKTLRHIASLNKNKIPVPAKLKQTLNDKTRSSLARLNYSLNTGSDKQDVAKKFQAIGVGGDELSERLGNLRRLSRTYWLPSSKRAPDERFTRSLGVQGYLQDVGKDFANIRKNIPRESWASQSEIDFLKQHLRQVRKAENLDPKLYPLNIHRRLFKGKDDARGSWGVTNVGYLGTVGRHLDRKGVARSNTFLHPLDPKDIPTPAGLRSLRGRRGAPLAIDALAPLPPQLAQQVRTNHLLWHETAGHGFDPRLRKSPSLLSRLLQRLSGQYESFADIVGAHGVNRNQELASNAHVQDYLARAYRANAQFRHRAKPLPYQTPESLVPPTDNVLQGARQTYNTIYPKKPLPSFGVK